MKGGPGRMEPIQFFDLKSQARQLRADIDARIAKVLDHGAYIGGPEVAELEEGLARFTGAKHAVAVASGTDALIMGLMGENIGPGDAVFIPGFTYNATANAVLVLGATPVFVDVEPGTCNMDPAHLQAQINAVERESRLTPRMVIAVDLYGLPADYPRINAIAAKHGLLVMADAAQSLGGGQGNARIGALAAMTATSFYPSKTLGAYGDGGAMFTDDAARADRWRSIRWHGTDAQKRESIRVGVNGRLDSIQCAVLLAKLAVFDAELKRRGEIACRYHELLNGVVEMQAVPDGSRSAWGLFTIMVDDRAAFQEKMKAQGVPTSIYYPIPLHKHAAFAPFAPDGGLPVCERLAARVVSLPMHPFLTDEQQRHIASAVKSAVA